MRSRARGFTVLVVSGSRLLTYDDGRTVPDAVYGFVTGRWCDGCCKCCTPHSRRSDESFRCFCDGWAIYLGSRSDRDENRHFLGDMAGLMISEEDLTPHMQCLFNSGELHPPPTLKLCT